MPRRSIYRVEWIESIDKSLARVQYLAVVCLAGLFPIGKSLAEISLGVGLIAWAARALLDRRRLDAFKNPLSPFIIAWLVIAFVSMHNSVDISTSIKGIVKLLKYSGLYFLVCSTVNSRKALQGVLRGCLIGLLLVCADGIWQVIFGKDLLYGRALDTALNTVRRVVATFNHPDDMSIYIVGVCPIALALALRTTHRRRLYLGSLSVLATVVMLLSWTRGGLLALVGEMLVLAFWLRSWAPIALAASATAAVALTVDRAVTAWAARMPTLLHLLAEPDRLSYWQAALNMIRKHPFIGIGVNTFARTYPIYRIPGDNFSQVGPYAHNQYLHLAAEIGLIGFGVFLFLLGRVFWTGKRHMADRSQATFEAVTLSGLLAGLVGFLILGLVESSLFYLQGATLFWLLVGLVMATNKLQTHRDQG